MKRKIVQIAVAAAPEYRDMLYGLCSDGSVWCYDLPHVLENGTTNWGGNKGEWVLLPPITQGSLPPSHG